MNNQLKSHSKIWILLMIAFLNVKGQGETDYTPAKESENKSDSLFASDIVGSWKREDGYWFMFNKDKTFTHVGPDLVPPDNGWDSGKWENVGDNKILVTCRVGDHIDLILRDNKTLFCIRNKLNITRSESSPFASKNTNNYSEPKEVDSNPTPLPVMKEIIKQENNIENRFFTNTEQPNPPLEDLKYEKLLNYVGVTVRKIEKDGIRIMHKDGVAKIPIEQLPEEIREELGLSMEGVQEHRDTVAAIHAEAALKARVMAANKKILEASYMRIESATVFQVVEGGILAHVKATSDGTSREVPTYKSVRVGSALSGYSTQKVRSGSDKVKNTSHHDDWLIFVSCDNKDLVDGSAFSGDVWAAGRFSYTTAIGGGKTIPKYTANPEEIINR